MIYPNVRRYGIVTSSFITAVLFVSMIAMPSAAAAKKTVLFNDPQNDCLLSQDPSDIGTSCADQNLDIKEVGVTDKGEAFLTVYGKSGATLSTVAGQVVYYAFAIDGGFGNGGNTYFITSHFEVEDSTETGNDQKFHAHKLVDAFSSSDCPNGYGIELVLNDDGNAKVSSSMVTLEGASGTTVNGAGSGILGLQINGDHVCYVSDVDFGDSTPNP